MPSPLHHQSHAAIQRHIERLREQHGRGKKRKSPVAFPDLKEPERGAPRGNNKPCKFSSQRSASGAHHKDAQQFCVGMPHKQGPMLVTPQSIKNGELKYMGGHGCKPKGD